MKFLYIVVAITAYYTAVNMAGFELARMPGFGGALVFIFIPLVFIPLMVTAIVASRSMSAALKKCISDLATKDFAVTHQIHKGNEAILADGKNSQICFVQFSESSPSRYSMTIYSSDQILASKIITDGQETTSASSSSMVGRALVGGLLFGGVGAIIGGVTATTKSNKKIKALELRVLVDGETESSHRVVFYSNPSGAVPDSLEVKAALEKIETWQVIVELLMMKEKIPMIESTKKFQDYVEALRIKKSRVANG